MKKEAFPPMQKKLDKEPSISPIHIKFLFLLAACQDHWAMGYKGHWLYVIELKRAIVPPILSGQTRMGDRHSL